MNLISRLRRQTHPYSLVIAAFGIYAILFTAFYHQAGIGIASLAIIPVIITSWFFGIRGGTLAAFLTTLYDLIVAYQTIPTSFELFRAITLIFIAVIMGTLSKVIREREQAFIRLEEHEQKRLSHTSFLELLNGITARALEASSLQTTLEILTEQLATLFNADDVYFAYWDEKRELTIPAVAYGSMSDIYPYITFQPGELTMTASALKMGQPIPVNDIEDSPYISPNVAGLLPSRSMLGIPLIAQGRKLGALLLGYNKNRTFDNNEIIHAGITGEQAALVLSKSLLLEDERKQVKQLTALHDVALTSIEADSEDQLIKRVTDIIGQNLFPDNFGVMLLDEKEEILRMHSSYHFYTAEETVGIDVQLGEGITGKVAQNGQSQRIGDVRLNPQYKDMDDRTISELCVPIKFKERILGVINAESKKRNAFTADDERLLATLAGQLATAIEQSRKAQGERKWLDQLAHSNDLIYSLAHVTTHIEKALEPDEIIRTLGVELSKIDLTCATALYQENTKNFVFTHTSMKADILEQFEDGIGLPFMGYTIPANIMKSTVTFGDIFQPVVVTYPEQEIKIFFPRGQERDVTKILEGLGMVAGNALLRLPLMFEENLLGILWLWGKGITATDLPIISIFAKQIGISLERARLFQEVQSLALTDPLTGLHNRRNIFELGRIEFSRAHRMERPFCCMLLDLDHFKQVNDHYGHQAGDQVLHEFAQRCKCAIREVDLIGRYGGEELIVILPETDLETALPIAERVRASVAETPIMGMNQEIHVTVSIGVAQKDENTFELETLIARADQAMYIAKHKGRNRVATSK